MSTKFKKLFITSILFFSMDSVAQSAVEAEILSLNCQNARGESELRSCLSSNYRQIKALLKSKNVQLNQMIANKPKDIEAFTLSRRKWLGFIKSHCKFQTVPKENETLKRLEVQQCIIDEVKHRTIFVTNKILEINASK
jgi:uncharacterized protein YecT (DUF1311 family)